MTKVFTRTVSVGDKFGSYALTKDDITAIAYMYKEPKPFFKGFLDTGKTFKCADFYQEYEEHSKRNHIGLVELVHSDDVSLTFAATLVPEKSEDIFLTENRINVITMEYETGGYPGLGHWNLALTEKGKGDIIVTVDPKNEVFKIKELQRPTIAELELSELMNNQPETPEQPTEYKILDQYSAMMIFSRLGHGGKSIHSYSNGSIVFFMDKMLGEEDKELSDLLDEYGFVQTSYSRHPGIDNSIDTLPKLMSLFYPRQFAIFDQRVFKEAVF